jgi:hypothetical protein
MLSPKMDFTFSNETSGECFSDAMVSAWLDTDKKIVIAARKDENDFNRWKYIVSP